MRQLKVRENLSNTDVHYLYRERENLAEGKHPGTLCNYMSLIRKWKL